jgi:hypothetical protein
MLLDDPQLFLHHVDFEQRLVFFVKASQALIDAENAHNFDDIEPKHNFDLDMLLEEGDYRDFRPPHFLFMTDFCGSTLLANALGALRGVSCYYEVRAFADLAIRKRLLDRKLVADSTNAADIEDWQRVLRLTIFSMSRNMRGDTVIVKEWPPANYIISDILRCHQNIKAIFLYSDIEDYLNAICRRHWRREFTRQRVVTELVETELWPMIHEGKHSFSDGKIAAAHWFVQQQAFLRVDRGVRSGIRSLHNLEFYNHPAETVAAVAKHFGIQVYPEEAANAFASVSNRHSKRRDEPYSMTVRQREMGLVAHSYRIEIDEAVAEVRQWLEAYPIPKRLPCELQIGSS